MRFSQLLKVHFETRVLPHISDTSTVLLTLSVAESFAVTEKLDASEEK